jgi:predicted nucleic acid-binding protein
MAADVVWAWLDDTFGSGWITLPADAQRLALARLAALGVVGGATYDGLIAISAAVSDATLVTLDTRAIVTYGRVGVAVELVV